MAVAFGGWSVPDPTAYPLHHWNGLKPAIYRFMFRFDSYFALLTDQYPPFRFVPGAREDGTSETKGPDPALPPTEPRSPNNSPKPPSSSSI